MSISTIMKPFSKRVVEVPLPPLTTETPRQEIFRLLDRAIHERGYDYVDRSHQATVARGGYRSVRYEPGCIMGYILHLKGISAGTVGVHGIQWHSERAGWDSEFRLIDSLMSYNDRNFAWGRIRDIVRQEYPIPA